MCAERTYYVYMYWEPDGTPRYVGLGKAASRWLRHQRASSDTRLSRRFKKLRRSGVIMPHQKVLKALTKAEACAEERRLIALHGRLGLDEGGTLFNRTLGGEGTAGLKRDPVEHAKAVEAARVANTGRPLTDEHRNNLSAYWLNLSESERQKISDKFSRVQTGHAVSDETKQKLKAAHANPEVKARHAAGTSAGLRGKPWSDTQRKALTGRKRSEEARANMRAAHARRTPEEKRDIAWKGWDTRLGA